MVDIIVIGGGPAGLNAGIYGKRSGLSVMVVEKVPYGAGQVALSNEVDNYLGLPGLGGYELGEAFKKHAESQGVEIKNGEAEKIEKKGDYWEITIKGDLMNDGLMKRNTVGLEKLSSSEVIRAKAVIYAAGAVYRPLPVDASQEDLTKSVSYCAVCDGAFYKGKDAAVIGGGDTALGDAMYLSQICRKVFLIHRRNEFRGSKDTLDKIKCRDNVEIIAPATLKKLERKDKEVILTLDSGKKLTVSRVFAAIGMTPKTELVFSFIELNRQGYIIADETGKTNVPGFFAAGDVRTKALRQVITAVSDGANAAVSAQEYIEKINM